MKSELFDIERFPKKASLILIPLYIQSSEAKIKVVSQVSVAEKGEGLIGVWAPPSRRILSSCFKILFPRMAAPLLIPEPPPKPPYISVCFPIEKRSKVQSMMAEWETEIRRYGIFSSCVPEEAKLIAKSFKKFDKADITKDGNEKIVIQLARKKSECILAFACELPVYMSPNISQGKTECKLFFPEGYDDGLEEEEFDDIEDGEADEEEDFSFAYDESKTAEKADGISGSVHSSVDAISVEIPLVEDEIEDSVQSSLMSEVAADAQT